MFDDGIYRLNIFGKYNWFYLIFELIIMPKLMPLEQKLISIYLWVSALLDLISLSFIHFWSSLFKMPFSNYPIKSQKISSLPLVLSVHLFTIRASFEYLIIFPSLVFVATGDHQSSLKMIMISYPFKTKPRFSIHILWTKNIRVIYSVFRGKLWTIGR